MAYPSQNANHLTQQANEEAHGHAVKSPMSFLDGLYMLDQWTNAEEDPQMIPMDFDIMHAGHIEDPTLSATIPDAMEGILSTPLPSIPGDVYAPRSPLNFETSDRQNEQSQHGVSCNCASHVLNQLLSMACSSKDDTTTAVTQLSQLKSAIGLSDKFIQCHCASDDVTILSIFTLAGRIAQGFETSLDGMSDGSCSSSSSGSGSCINRSSESGTSSTPRLSWGALQFEADDEESLKQHLWLLHFRKFEAWLRRFNASTQQMKNSQRAHGSKQKNTAHSAGGSAQMMAYECLYMWLEQKAQCVRERFAIQYGKRQATQSLE